MNESENYRNLARKYRPEDFNDVVGQTTVTKTLANSLKMGRVAHAYLLYGPRGCGKTTSARILAKSLNCTGNGATAPVAEPCGKCPSCLEIASGSDLDVLEIDAASNTQVEKVREVIIDTVSLSSTRDRYKVFILDEVHMLSASSFNALLKTIEEPPSHVVFILATTERHKVPATILSRCQTFRFKPISVSDISARLAGIAAKENIDITPDALTIIARAASGALRDALTLLDRAVSYSTGKIDGKMVAEMLGYTPEELVRKAVSALLSNDGASMHAVFETLREEGYETMAFLRDLRNSLSDLFFFASGFGDAPFAGAKELLASRGTAAVAIIARRLGKLIDEVKFSDIPSLSAEIGVFTLMESGYDLDGLVRRLEDLEGRLASGQAPAVSAPRRLAEPAPRRVSPEPASAPRRTASAPEPERPAPVQSASPVFSDGTAMPDGVIWKKILDSFVKESPMLFGMLSSCTVQFDGDRWTLGFTDTFNREAVERNAKKLEEAARRIAARSIKFAFSSVEKKTRFERVKPVSAPTPADEEPAISSEPPFVEGNYQFQDAETTEANDASFERVLKIIPGRIIRKN